MVGTNIIVPTSLSATTDATGAYSISLQGNDTISPDGTYYSVTFATFVGANYEFVGTGPLNLNTYPPITVIPVPTSPVPTNILTSNNIFTGTNVFSGSIEFSSISFTNFTVTGTLTCSTQANFVALSASGQITSTVVTGTAPFVIASTTVVPNLNAALLNGTTFASPAAIGTGTPGAGTFTALNATSSPSLGIIGGVTPDIGHFTTVTTTGKITTYNNVTTVASGIPAEYAQVNLTAQNAVISATTLYAVPVAGAGMYRISWVAKITIASDNASALGGTTGFQVVYTDADDSVVTTTAGTPPTFVDTQSVASKPLVWNNTTGTQINGTVIVNAKASTNIQYKFGYTDTHTTTAMVYSLKIRLEAI